MSDASDRRQVPACPNESRQLARLNLIGESPKWKATLGLVQRIATTDATALIEGETGTGKELVARAMHYLSSRRDFPFIPVHCGALPDGLLEAELFGHEKGAFTDARERRTGLIAEAKRGTLFLDEVEAMSPRAQVVVLRFLQDQTYLPVGGRNLITADARVVAASNADLAGLVTRREFRSDLLFRLRVLNVHLPPLRERPGDVGLLARTFLDRFSRTYGRPSRQLSALSLSHLESHDWPGNVRELEGLLLRAFLLQEGDELTIPPFGCAAAPPEALGSLAFPAEFKRAKALAVAEFEKAYLSQLLRRARGNISLASRLSHKDRSALNRLIKKHGIVTDAFREQAKLDGSLGLGSPRAH